MNGIINLDGLKQKIKKDGIIQKHYKKGRCNFGLYANNI